MESGSKRRATISAFIVCMNEERQIERCLKSVSWCDEIVIIDSGSTDRTLEIARKFTPHIFHRTWSGYVEQKAFGLEKCSSEWILNLDADEEVSDQLRDSIISSLVKDSLSTDSNRVNGYFISRVVFFMGRYWDKGGWYPEYRLRCCRKSATTWGGVDPHEKASVKGRTAKLAGELYHYTFSDLTDQVRRANTLSGNAAFTLYNLGERAKLSDLVFRPIFRFIKFYLFKKGFLEGKAGLVVACIEAGQVFLKYAKLWELNSAHPKSNRE